MNSYGYRYDEVRPQLFTDEGQRMLLRIRDRVRFLLDEAGAFRLQEAIAKETGDMWQMVACVERLVELGEIEECPQNLEPMTQHRIFKGRRR